ncbi:MAG: hypothetical protein MAG715_00112 [Methanonatronarchaeales archaeon]|nr:hypothetical protein [Methanonatronarchaeales archaeon]
MPRALSVALSVLILATVASTVQGATATSIDVDVDGDAHWTVEVREWLSGDDEEAAFRRFAEDVEEMESTQRFESRLLSTVSAAGNRTGRDMVASNFTASADVEGLSTRWGVVRYTFDWHGFAGETDGELVVGDAIEGYYLAEDDSLEIGLPGAAEVVEAEPGPDEVSGDSVTWRGPESFGDGEPRVRAALDGSTGPGSTGTGTGGEAGNWRDRFLPAALLATVVLIGIGAWLFVWRSTLELDGERGGREEVPVPDGERVMELLREAGGRMRQAEVVERTGWSEAKVSNVTNSLKDGGRLVKRRWGRENVLLLPDKVED